MKKFFTILFITSVFLILFSVAALADVTVYPEYPDEVTKNFDYSVTVVQSGKEYRLNTYSLCRQQGIVIGDDYRRFSEFSFDGSVEVRITSSAFDLSKATIVPYSVGKTAVYENGVLTVKLDKPCQFVVEEGRDFRTALAVFADAHETDVPNEDDENVVYIKPGWTDVENDFLTLKENQTLYIAPGAVLNGHIRIEGDNVTVKGRGILRDKLFKNNNEVPTYMVFVLNNRGNVKIQDIKVLDSKVFNLVFNEGVHNTVADNVKLMSNKSNSDGFSYWNVGKNNEVKNCFTSIGDNVFIFAYPNEEASLNVRNCLVGSTAAIFCPQSNVKGKFMAENIDVFACNESKNAEIGMIVHLYSNNKAAAENDIASMTLKNVDAAYCNRIINLLSANLPGKGEKNIFLNNVWLPDGVVRGVRILQGGGYNMHWNNVWLGNTLVTDKDSVKVHDGSSPSLNNSFSKDISQIKVFVNGTLVRFDSEPYITPEDRTMIPIRAVSETLGAEVLWNDAEQSVTISLGEKNIKLVIGDTNALANGETQILDAAPVVQNDRTYVPLRFVSETLGFPVDYNENSNSVVVTVETAKEGKTEGQLNAELLKNADFENGIEGWAPRNDCVAIIKDNSAASGSKYALITDRKFAYSGISQDVISILNANGSGKYKISAYVKAGESGTLNEPLSLRLKYTADVDTASTYKSASCILTGEWQKVEATIDVNWSGELLDAVLYVETNESKTKTTADLCVDNFSMVKIDGGQ